MSAPNSEARKNIEARAARERARNSERRREVAQAALERIYSGAGFAEADCLLDAFADLGARLEVSQ